VNLFQDGKEMLEDVSWEYWEQLHTSFTVLLPLLGEERIKAYLDRLERGVRAKGHFEASEFGAKVHWDKVPWESGLKYCLCGDHRLRGMCVHVIAWMWIHGFIEPPDLWAPTRMHEKNDSRGRERDHLYVHGSARKREMSTSAQHSVQKAQKHARAGTGGHMPQAVLFSQGCLKGWCDSVRKGKTTRPQKKRCRESAGAMPAGSGMGRAGRKNCQHGAVGFRLQIHH